MTISAQKHEQSSTVAGGDVSALKARMKATWEDGDYAEFAHYMEDGAIEILDRWRLPPSRRLLDIGCGSGQTAIPAARQGHRVTGIDIAENLVMRARERASGTGLPVRFDIGDAEDLPYEDNSFDTVISLIGAMFAPRPDYVVEQLARVIQPGGQLCMANWTPASMPAQMFRCLSAYVPPPAGVVSPVLWGDEEVVAGRLEQDFTHIKFRRRVYPRWHYPFGPTDIVKLFRAQFGPVKKAFDSLGIADQEKLFGELRDIYAHNGRVDGKGYTITGGEYLDITATRRPVYRG